MTIYLVRHAKAGERGAWDGDDELRPLSGRGHAQARNLLDVLVDADFERVISSPYVRCMETVVPLAAARRIALEVVRCARRGRVVAGSARTRSQACGSRCGAVHARRRDADAARALRQARRRPRQVTAVAEGLHVGARNRRDRRGPLGALLAAAVRRRVSIADDPGPNYGPWFSSPGRGGLASRTLSGARFARPSSR